MKVEHWPLSRLKPQTRINPKQHPSEQVAKIAATIKRLGFRFPIAVDGEGRIVAGHGRLLAAKRLKLAKVPVVQHADLTEQQARELMLADNQLNRATGNDASKLTRLTEELEAAGCDLADLGFDADELSMAAFDAIAGDDPEPPPPPGRTASGGASRVGLVDLPVLVTPKEREFIVAFLRERRRKGEQVGKTLVRTLRAASRTQK